MAQPSVVEANGVPAQVNGEMDPAAMPGKRKRETSDDGDEEMEGIEDVTPDKVAEWAPRDQKALIKSYYEVLKRYVHASILTPQCIQRQAGK
jgi:hypothetical protein